MEDSRVTLKMIAGKAGVSVMTVSYALRDSKQVSESTKARIQKIARQLGYSPDPVMSRLASYRSRKKRTERRETLAWLNLHPEEKTWNYRGSHILEALEGAQRRVQHFGYYLESFCVPQSGGWPGMRKILRARGIRGVVIAQPPDGIHRAELNWKDIATVAIGRAITTPDLSRVVLNHTEAVNRLMDRMHHLGYQRIGLVMEKEACRKNAYRNVSAFHGSCERLEIPLGRRVPPLLPPSLNASLLKKWIERWEVDGIVVNRPDQMQKFLPEIGLQVPRDIGYAHLSLPSADPVISGFHMDPGFYGSWAVDLVHWLLNREETGLPDPVPSLNLTAMRWNKGQTLRPQK